MSPIFFAVRMVALVIVLGVILAGCKDDKRKAAPAPEAPPAPGPVTIANPIEYLVQSRNLDGNTATPLRSADELNKRRFDYGRWQVMDSFLLPDGSAITAYGFTPFGPFVAANGDGGERHVIEGEVVRATATRDGGTKGDQHFVGKECGGTGWVLFRTDATSEWKSLVARLGNASDPGQCSAASAAYTRYTLRTVNFPKLGDISAVVSEHYDRATIATSGAMERTFFGLGWGRLAWQAYARSPVNIADLYLRCPAFGWDAPPGWYLVDCRIAVNVEDADGSLSGDDLWAPGKEPRQQRGRDRARSVCDNGRGGRPRRRPLPKPRQ